MSVKFRILIPMVVISIVAASVILILNIIQFSSFVDDYMDDELERAALKVIDVIDRMKMESHTAMLYYANDNELIDAMSRGDREAVLKRSVELYSHTNIESLSIVDSEGIVLARGHNPELYGDDASSMSIVTSALNGKQLLSLERGVSTKASVRSASPVYDDNGQILGALFVGDRMDTDSFVDRLKTFSGCEITVFIDDVRVATTLFGRDGNRATNSYAKGYTKKAMETGEDVSWYTSFQGQKLVAKYTELQNENGDVIGIIAVEKYLADKHEIANSFVITGIIVAVVFVFLSILITLFVSGKLAAQIDRRIGLVNYDKLTGIFNRHYFEERFNILLKTLSRSGGVVSLLMIDVDFFKEYNDTYGHVKGDSCLRAVAEILSETVTRADDFVARYGGEEFVAVLPNADEAGAKTVAKRLLEAMKNHSIPHKNSNAADHVTVSIGVTTGKVHHTARPVDFIRQADFALYESKKNGRKTYSVFNIR